jgi:hypothetical protein
MGVWMFRSNPGEITVTGPSIFGVVLLLAAVVGGHCVCSQLRGRCADVRRTRSLC